MRVMDMISFEICFHITNSGELGLSNTQTKSKIVVVFTQILLFENADFDAKITPSVDGFEYAFTVV